MNKSEFFFASSSPYSPSPPLCSSCCLSLWTRHLEHRPHTHLRPPEPRYATPHHHFTRDSLPDCIFSHAFWDDFGHPCTLLPMTYTARMHEKICNLEGVPAEGGCPSFTIIEIIASAPGANDPTNFEAWPPPSHPAPVPLIRGGGGAIRQNRGVGVVGGVVWWWLV